MNDLTTGLTWDADATASIRRLHEPIVIIAFEGLFDAAQSATSAVKHLRRAGNAVTLAHIDPEEYFDFTEQRPLVSLDSNDKRVITWPKTSCFGIRTEGDQPDMVLIVGIEPHLRWRSFAATITTITKRTNASLVVTVGAMVGMAPHTRALGVVGSATNETLADRMGLGRPSYQGPTGLIGVLHTSLHDADIPVISLRVSVPHYVPAPPNAEATRSLLARLELVTGITTDHQSLEVAAADWQQRVNEAVADEPDMARYVANLEEQIDAQAENLLPSGDDLAAELQAWLREQ